MSSGSWAAARAAPDIPGSARQRAGEPTLPEEYEVSDDGFELDDAFDVPVLPETRPVPVLRPSEIAQRREVAHSKIFTFASEGDAQNLMDALDDALEAKSEGIDTAEDVNAALPDGTTALMVAVEESHLGCVEALLLSKADANAARRSDGCTPLISAVLQGSSAIVTRLLLAKADANACLHLPDGISAVYQACARGRTRILSELLAAKARPNCVHPTDGSTPLIVCAANGNEDCLRVLLATGSIDVDEAKADGASALMVAAAAGHVGAVKVLLASKADASAAACSRRDGASVLFAAVQADQHALIDVLLSGSGNSEAAVNARRASDQMTPLEYAAAKANSQTLAALLRQGASCNLPGSGTTQSRPGRLPLFAACAGGVSSPSRCQCVRLLVQHAPGGALVNARRRDGTTALMAAAAAGNAAECRALLDLQADVAATRRDGSTALHVAAEAVARGRPGRGGQGGGERLGSGGGGARKCLEMLAHHSPELLKVCAQCCCEPCTTSRIFV